MRWLIIGCGSIGKRHIGNLLELKAGDIIAHDLREDRRREVCSEFGVETVDTLEEGWEREPDVAVIASDTITHLPLALEAARRGCHMFIEKPLAVNMEGIDLLLREVGERKLITMVGCNLKFHPLVRKVKSLIDKNTIGSILGVRAEFGQYLPDWHPWEDYRLGYSARRNRGGGAILDVGIHEIDYLRWMVGEITDVSCFADHISDLEIDTEDTASMLLRFANGAIGELHVDYLQRKFRRTLRVIGSEGTIFWDKSAGEIRLYSAHDKSDIVINKPDGWRYNDMFVDQMNHFLACVGGKEKPMQDVFEAAASLGVLDAAKKSALNGRAIKLEKKPRKSQTSSTAALGDIIKPVRIGSRIIGCGEPCFITFEAGPTHTGIESALRLVRHAARAGADAIKFQIIDPERLMADHDVQFSFGALVDRDSGKTETVTESLYDILCRRVLSRDEWRMVKKEADDTGIAFFATACFDDEVDFIAEIGCQSIKISSGDVNHAPLIRHASKTGLCIQLDTGNSTLNEIADAVDIIRGEGNENIIIHHCPSGYPARTDGVNLNIVTSLKERFPYPVAFSDHSPDWDMDIAVVSMGINLIEKTITEDRTIRGPEHIMSLEPEQMNEFVQVIRGIENALGSFERAINPEELQSRRIVRRGAYLEQAVKQGQKLREAQVIFQRPAGNGIGGNVFERSLDLSFCHDLPAGHLLTREDLS